MVSDIKRLQQIATKLHYLFCEVDHEDRVMCNWYFEDWTGTRRKLFLKMASKLVEEIGSLRKTEKVMRLLAKVEEA